MVSGSEELAQVAAFARAFHCPSLSAPILVEPVLHCVALPGVKVASILLANVLQGAESPILPSLKPNFGS